MSLQMNQFHFLQGPQIQALKMEFLDYRFLQRVLHVARTGLYSQMTFSTMGYYSMLSIPLC